jgi:transposase
MGKRTRRYPRDEGLYNLVQENEIPLFIACLPGAVEAVLDRETLWQGVGRPPARLRDILICLVIKQYFDLSLRRAIGLLWLLRRTGCIDVKVPCFKTLGNYMNNGAIQMYLDRLVELTAALFSQVERCIATDTSGISTTGSSSWFNIRVRRRIRKRDHIMVHISVGTRSNVVVALDIRRDRGGDNEILRSHVERVSEAFDVDEWSGDRYYLTQKNCDAVSAIGAEPLFKLKSNTRARAGGSPAWRRMVLAFQNHPRVANAKYHRRSNVESAYSAKKRKFSNSVRGRSSTSQRIEESISWVGYNLSLVPRARYEFGVDIPFVG